MPKLKRRLGINLTASNFQYVEISFTGQEFQLESFGDCDLDEEVDWCNGKETIIRMQLDNLFSELKKRKIKTNFVSFSLPFDIFLINQLVYHQELIGPDLITQYNWELDVLYPHINVADYIIKVIPLRLNTLTKYQTCLVAALRKKPVDLIQEYCNTHQFNIQFFDLPHFSFDKVVQFARKEINIGVNSTIYLTRDFLSFELIENGETIFYKLLQIKSLSEAYSYIKDFSLIDGLIKNKIKEIHNVYFYMDGDVENANTGIEELTADFTRINPFNNLQAGGIELKSTKYFAKPDLYAASAGLVYRLF